MFTCDVLVLYIPICIMGMVVIIYYMVLKISCVYLMPYNHKYYNWV